jgi:hypothetical protein
MTNERDKLLVEENKIIYKIPSPNYFFLHASEIPSAFHPDDAPIAIVASDRSTACSKCLPVKSRLAVSF